MIDDPKPLDLTSEASEMLNSISDALRSEIIISARLKAKEKNELFISTYDILQAYNSILKRTVKIADARHYSLKDKLLKILSLLGFLYLIFGIGIYIYDKKLIDFHYKTDKGLLVAFFGFLSLSLSFLFKRYFPTNNKNSRYKFNISDSPPLDFIIVRKWNTIEKLTISLMELRGESLKSKSIPNVLKFLNNQFVETDSDKVKLKDLLNKRNQIVHGGLELKEDTRQIYINFADELISRLENAVTEEGLHLLPDDVNT